MTVLFFFLYLDFLNGGLFPYFSIQFSSLWSHSWLRFEVGWSRDTSESVFPICFCVWVSVCGGGLSGLLVGELAASETACATTALH